MLEIPSISIQCANNLVFQTFFIWNTCFFYRNPRFSVEILTFSLEILGISKICDNSTSYIPDNYSLAKVQLKYLKKYLDNNIALWKSHDDSKALFTGGHC